MSKSQFLFFEFESNVLDLQCVIIDKSDNKKTVRSRLEYSAIDYSYLSNKRTCPLILFKKKVQPTL